MPWASAVKLVGGEGGVSAGGHSIGLAGELHQREGREGRNGREAVAGVKSIGAEVAGDLNGEDAEELQLPLQANLQLHL